jgi:hypothetical protein
MNECVVILLLVRLQMIIKEVERSKILYSYLRHPIKAIIKLSCVVRLCVYASAAVVTSTSCSSVLVEQQHDYFYVRLDRYVI